MNCSEIRGFNYNGSWGTSGLDIWLHHQHGTMAEEIKRGKQYFPKWNVARWWLSDEAFYRNPNKFLANLEAGLSVFDENEILVVPVLFNRWRDPDCDFGGVALEHIVPGFSTMSAFGIQDLFEFPADSANRKLTPIESNHYNYLNHVVSKYKDDERIFAWDLCNEPLMAPYSDDPENFITRAELKWVTWLYNTCKLLGATAPLFISNFANMNVMRMTEPISDILSFHPYLIYNGEPKVGAETVKEGFIKFLDGCVSLGEATGKELYASETVWGDVDDAARVQQIHESLEELKLRNIGFTVHALQHSLVADLHYPEYGPFGKAGAMHFVNPDGKIRPGHEAFNQYC